MSLLFRHLPPYPRGSSPPFQTMQARDDKRTEERNERNKERRSRNKDRGKNRKQVAKKRKAEAKSKGGGGGLFGRKSKPTKATGDSGEGEDGEGEAEGIEAEWVDDGDESEEEEQEPMPRDVRMETLIGFGADVNLHDENYVPLIHIVAQADDIVALNILLKHGARADVVSREPQFNSPLHAAVRLSGVRTRISSSCTII